MTGQPAGRYSATSMNVYIRKCLYYYQYHNYHIIFTFAYLSSLAFFTFLIKVVADGLAGQVLAGPLFLKILFYKKQVINRSARVIIVRLVALVQ